MTDNELLLAISDMMDKKLNHITKDVQEVKKDIKVLKTEVENIDIRVKNIELNQETKVLPRLNTIESCYTSTYDRYKDSVEDYEAIKQDVSIMKKVIQEHSIKLQNIS
ncbi:hypothetical protein D7V72_14705 [bacterium D16-36]|nr:hypothetical protein [Lachnospiraceae bacterium]RKI25517.1 hypothetical protein D7V72_14705 [bacterium D16-36]